MHFWVGMPLEVKGNPQLLLMRGWETPSTSLGSQSVVGGSIAPGWGVQWGEGLKDVLDLELYLSTF